MSESLGAMCDDLYVNSRLFVKLPLPSNRETLLGFFDRLRKAFPSLTKLRRADDGALTLEEDRPEGGSRRWIRLEETSLRFGYFAPPHVSDARELGNVILEHAPYHLSFSELDYDHMEVVYGFDLEFRGNHDQLVAETLMSNHPLASFMFSDDAYHVLDMQPFMGIALTPSCDIQAYIDIKSRTSSYEVRTGEYEAHPLSVYLTIRKYWGFSESENLIDAHQRLMDYADELAADRIVPLLVNPLAHAIASRS